LHHRTPVEAGELGDDLARGAGGRPEEVQWKANDGDYTTLTRLEFEPLEGNATLVRISEGKWTETQQGLDASYGNCMGWTRMLCAMKLYVERGINLRELFF